MDMIEKAFRSLYPNRNFNYTTKLTYSGRFKAYNAYVRYTIKRLEFNISKEWYGVSEEIVIGLLQFLMNKVFKTKLKTDNIDLYNSFMKNIHIAIPKTKTHPILEDSFNRVNMKFFDGLMERPNLILSKNSISKLGSYEYGSDTIKISDLLLDDFDALDYVMYHEMLHKEQKFKASTKRHTYHTKEFKRKENLYPDSDIIEERLSRLVRSRRKKKTLFGRFF